MNKTALVFVLILSIATPKTVAEQEIISAAVTASSTTITQVTVSATEILNLQLHTPTLQSMVVKVPTIVQSITSTITSNPIVTTKLSIREYAKQLVDSTFGVSQFAAFDKLIMAESSWNPAALNPSSGACGLAQALPCSKYTNHSPEGQIEWAVKYISDRYGDANTAWAHEIHHGWY